MINVTNSRTLCCSITCEKRFECGRAGINNIGTYYVEDYSRFGTGTFTDNGCEIEHWCGEEGDYKMFEPVKKRGLRSSVLIIDDLCGIEPDEIAQIIHYISTNEWAKDYMEAKQLKT